MSSIPRVLKHWFYSINHSYHKVVKHSFHYNNCSYLTPFSKNTEKFQYDAVVPNYEIKFCLKRKKTMTSASFFKKHSKRNAALERG